MPGRNGLDGRTLRPEPPPRLAELDETVRIVEQIDDRVCHRSRIEGGRCAAAGFVDQLTQRWQVADQDGRADAPRLEDRHREDLAPRGQTEHVCRIEPGCLFGVVDRADIEQPDGAAFCSERRAGPDECKRDSRPPRRKERRRLQEQIEALVRAADAQEEDKRAGDPEPFAERCPPPSETPGLHTPQTARRSSATPSPR